MAENEPEPIQLETLFRVLATRRCRTTLSCLESRDRPQTITALAARVTAVEHDGAGAVPAEIDRVRLLLHHSDLPRLDDADLVTYDRERGTVERAARFDGATVRSILEVTSDDRG